MRLYRLLTIGLTLLLVSLAFCNKPDELIEEEPVVYDDRATGVEMTDATWLDDIPFQDITMGAAASCPDEIDLSLKFPRPKQQIGSTCVCYALTYYNTYLYGRYYKGREITQEQLENQLMLDPNALCAKLNSRSPGYSCNESNVGISAAIAVLVSTGFVKSVDLGYTILKIDDPSVCDMFFEPSMDSSIKIDNLYQIKVSIPHIAGNLCSNNPIIAGIRVPKGFDDITDPEVIPYRLPDPVEWDMNDHMLLIIGYAPPGTEHGGDSTRSGAFKLLNSWGKGWGEKGYLWVDAEDLLEMMTNVTWQQPFALGNDLMIECTAGLTAPVVAIDGQPSNGGLGGGFSFDFNAIPGASSYISELGKYPYEAADFKEVPIEYTSTRLVEIIDTPGMYQFRVRGNKSGCPEGDWLYSKEFMVGDSGSFPPVIMGRGLDPLILSADKTSGTFAITFSKPVTGVDTGVSIDGNATIELVDGADEGPYTFQVTNLKPDTVYNIYFQNTITDGAFYLSPKVKQVIVMPPKLDVSDPCFIPESWDIECTATNGCILHASLLSGATDTPCKLDSTAITSYNEVGIERTVDGAILGTDKYITISGESIIDGSVFMVYQLPEENGASGRGLWDFGSQSGCTGWSNEVAAYIDFNYGGESLFAYSSYGDEVCCGFGGIGTQVTQGDFTPISGDYLVSKYTFRTSLNPDMYHFMNRRLGLTYNPVNTIGLLDAEVSERPFPYTADAVMLGCMDGANVNQSAVNLTNASFGISAELEFYPLESNVVAIFVYNQPQSFSLDD